MKFADIDASRYDRDVGHSGFFSREHKMIISSLSSRWLAALVILGLVFHLGCEKKESAGESSTERASVQSVPVKIPSAGYEFETPVRITAGDEYVSVESPGYACPTLADVDEDGKLDLVVGQFNNGYMQFCKNIAAENESPEFAAAEWIKTGDDRAVVPGVW